MSMNDLLYPSSYVRADNNNIPSWYEFLLKPDLLNEHLKESDPEPSGCSLIKQFYDQANRPKVNDQGQILPPPDSERNKSVKSLALQTASLLKWNLDLFEQELPIATRHQLLMELMKACKTSMPVAPQNELGNALEKMHDHSIMAVVLYCRWGARTVVKSTFPSKPGGRITPTVPQSVPYQANAQQRCDEVRDQILAILKDQVFDIVQYLEAVLHHVKRVTYLPSDSTFSPDSAKPDDNSAGIAISCEELHAQICYDLGCLHFAHNFYEKAGEMFGFVEEWLRRLPDGERSGFCYIDESTLNGYRTACQMMNKSGEAAAEDAVNENDSLFLKIKNCIKQKGSALRELGEIIIEDTYKKELSTSFLDEVENELVTNKDGVCGSDTIFDVKWSNAVRRAIRGVDQPTGLWTHDMNVAQLQRIIGFVQQISGYLSHVEGKRLGTFLYSLANNLTDTTLREQLLNFEVTRRLVSRDDLNELILRLEVQQMRPLVLENESPASPENMTSSPTLTDKRISELEQTLLTTFDPYVVKEVLPQLHSTANGRKYFNLCVQWELENLYTSAINSSTKDTSTYDLLHILIAKSHLCCLDGDFGTAKSLISYVHKNFTNIEEMKIAKVASNELLKVELLELLNDENLHYAGQEECGELRGQLSDVVTRCRHLLTKSSDQSKLQSLPSYLVQLSTAMLLNLEDLTFFISVARSPTSAPCLRLACLLASVRAGLIDRSLEPRKPASELWSASMVIFSTVASMTNTTNSRNASKKSQIEPLRNLLPSNAIISRPAFIEFVKLIKNRSVLQIIVSLLVHLHRLCRTDILSDITAPNSGPVNALWPTGLDGTPISGVCVTLALREVLTYCITTQPRNKSWVRTQADVHYAFNNYSAALRAYLLLGAYDTNYFNDVSTSGPYDDDQVIQRMIKCCMQMRCFTQAAVLCQLTKDIDYPTAFKALQENRDRTDAAEAHYLDHIWDVQILEHAAYEHRESGESLKKVAAISASTRPELNHSNAPRVGARVKSSRKTRFFQAMARQYLC